MPCRVRYLNSAGIHPREIKAVQALSEAWPREWLLYASLQHYPKNQKSIEIDIMLVMDDRVLLLEVKDWRGELTSERDQWFIDASPRGRSAVDQVAHKGRVMAKFFKQAIPKFDFRVDQKVVLSGTATKDKLADSEKKNVWSLAEACSIADRKARLKLLPTVQLRAGAKPAYGLESEFERIVRNVRLFRPLETNWDGYRITDLDIAVHPQKVWTEHKGELFRDNRQKAVIRTWAFNNLPPTLNSEENRRIIADRESAVVGHLSVVGSDLLNSGAILSTVSPDKPEILTNHYDVRRLPSEFTTLDKWLHKKADHLTDEDRVLVASRLLTIVSDLHKANISHRDLGPRCIWMSTATNLAITSFLSAQVPTEQSVQPWLSLLRGYSEALPEDAASNPQNSMQRDVYQVGSLLKSIFEGDGGVEAPLDSAYLNEFKPIIERSTQADPANRFRDASEMLYAFGETKESAGTEFVDQAILDGFERKMSPHFEWRMIEPLKETSSSQLYLSQTTSNIPLVVKIWTNGRRGLASDVALVAQMEGISRIIRNPVPGLPEYVACGITQLGSVAVYKRATGDELNSIEFIEPDLAIELATKLVSSVDYLHSIGITHGDLNPGNVIVDIVGRQICTLDHFDLPVLGGRVRTPDFCPDQADLLTEYQIDRYAVAKLVIRILRKANEPRLDKSIARIEEELGREKLETLEPVQGALRDAKVDLTRVPPPEFHVIANRAESDRLNPDHGRMYVTVQWEDDVNLLYRVAGLTQELTIRIQNDQVISVREGKLAFHHLSKATEQGVGVEMEISLQLGAEPNADTLVAYLRDKVPVPEKPASKIDDAKSKEELDAPIPSRPNFPALDVAKYWRRLIDIEENLLPEIEILQELVREKGPRLYQYEKTGADFDFDDDAIVDARLYGKWHGEVDIGSLTENTITILKSNRPLRPGDKITLAERKSRSSLDRRSKAVERILKGETPIAGLINYFCPAESPPTDVHEVDIRDDDLQIYNLNSGQMAAFKHIITTGPLGLLQGPPGTGKTHFIAALTHWLLTKGGAQKILIASQSNEAVNNAMEELLDLFAKTKVTPSILRIGTRGISDRVRPYHTSSLREAYKTRFDASARFRIGMLARNLGLKKPFSDEAFEIDRQLSDLVHRLKVLTEAEKFDDTAEDARDTQRRIRTVRKAFSAAGQRLLDRPIEPEREEEELDAAYYGLLGKHDVQPSDVNDMKALLSLARDWSTSLTSSARNFEEFLVKTRSIVAATCVGAGQTKIGIDTRTYDWVIVDEAARCAASDLAVPIQVAKRVLLVGDHLQLRPMIQKEVVRELRKDLPNASEDELTRSDFARSYTSEYGKANGQVLTEQYRMRPEICNMVSHIFYEPNSVKLMPSEDREAIPIFESALPGVLKHPVTWIDTSKDQSHVERRPEKDDTTLWNEAEAYATLRLLERISENEDVVRVLRDSHANKAIGVICMYSAQRQKIQELFYERSWDPQFMKLVRIETVDSYQGKENVIAIASLVRCNTSGIQGHVRSRNRCNVAFSRAKERLYVIGARSMWSTVDAGSPVKELHDYLVEKTPASIMMTREI